LRQARGGIARSEEEKSLIELHIRICDVGEETVNTDLGGKGMYTIGAPLDAFANGIFQGLQGGRQEIGYGTSNKALRLSRDEIDAAVQGINSRIPF
jgi:uncharacterized oxidoreductase